MKKAIGLILIIIVFFALLTFGIFGFVRAQEKEKTIQLLENNILDLEEKLKNCN